jgi:glutamate formiminotransferase/formiminotetrahydrofolate cyclodeaminase
MPNALVECIPNFSEARRPEVIEAIVAALTTVTQVTLLNQSSDNDHNRSVITFAGPPAAVEEAAFRGIRKAAELIDLDQHTGTHPRLGATDVVPFVPLAGVSMAECVQIARRLGERVGRELQIPVYFYEEAATRPERVNLEDVRRGQYEALKEEIGSNPDRKPDCGPSRLTPAGATIIGARNPLIAYNVYLTTDDIDIAKAIARSMRASSGGYRFVKALGMLVNGRAQVSMNLTNFRQTPVFRVVETIRREAARYGVGIHSCELVGLIPQEALIDSAVWYLQLDGFDPDQILEKRLYESAAQSPQADGAPFLDALAASTPTPGGGSAAAYAGAMGAALVAMVARLTVGRKKYAEVEAQMNEILNLAERLQRELAAAVEEDSSAFKEVLAAFKLPKDTPEQQKARQDGIEAATLKAAQVPLSVARKAVTVMGLAEQAVGAGNLNAISDAASAAALARSALTSAGYNIRINLVGLSDRDTADQLLAQLASLEEKAGAIEKNVQKSIQERGGFSMA